MASLISQYLIDQYAAGPSSTRVAAVKSLHEDVRKALAEAAGSKFDTFLQGSYRNNTAIADINDVDIVALYDPWTVPVSHSGWQSLFESVASILRGSWRVSGSVMIADKCVKLVGNLKADIVPAVSRTSYSSSDPIHIYSRSNSQERPNFPRTHYQNGALKQAATNADFHAGDSTQLFS